MHSLANVNALTLALALSYTGDGCHTLKTVLVRQWQPPSKEFTTVLNLTVSKLETFSFCNNRQCWHFPHLWRDLEKKKKEGAICKKRGLFFHAHFIPQTIFALLVDIVSFDSCWQLLTVVEQFYSLLVMLFIVDFVNIVNIVTTIANIVIITIVSHLVLYCPNRLSLKL